jgi:uncharacterized membrane protein
LRPATGSHDIAKLELAIARLLRIGVLAAGTLIAIGWVGSLGLEGHSYGSLSTYAPSPLPASISALARSGAWAPLVCYAGLALLVALPLARVLLTALLFARTGERFLSCVAACVFLALVLSFLLGLNP